jgi:hypothetical protein
MMRMIARKNPTDSSQWGWGLGLSTKNHHFELPQDQIKILFNFRMSTMQKNTKAAQKSIDFIRLSEIAGLNSPIKIKGGINPLRAQLLTMIASSTRAGSLFIEGVNVLVTKKYSEQCCFSVSRACSFFFGSV